MHMKRCLIPLLGLALWGCGNDGYEKIAPGLEMKKINVGTGRGMQNGSDYFYLSAHVLDQKDRPFENPSFDPHFFYLTQLKEPAYSYDFTQALPGLHSGDSVSFKTAADSLFLFYYGIQAPSALAGQTIHLHVHLVNVMSENDYYTKLEQAKEESKTNAFSEFERRLRKDGVTADPIGTGTVKQTLTPGEGPDAYYGDVVTLHMEQRLFDGTEIENSRKEGGPLEYEIGSDYGLKGLDEALVKMKKGEKARVYLPYFLAFGETGQSPKIPPYANLVMVLEVIDIQKPHY